MKNEIVVRALLCITILIFHSLIVCFAFTSPSDGSYTQHTSSSQYMMSNPSHPTPAHNVNEENSRPSKRRGARVAFVGNSILYFNDTPRFLVRLGKGGDHTTVTVQPRERGDTPYDSYIEHQDSCLCGGASLESLWSKGNRMLQHGFSTDSAKIATSDGTEVYDVGSPNVNDLLECNPKKDASWDFVVMNDHTHGPARPESRKATETILLERYVPLLLANWAIPIVIETAAYRIPGINNSEDLGSTRDFQSKVKDGVRSYLEAMQTKLPEYQTPRMAPVGFAYLTVHDNRRELWEKLFDEWDDFHPSPSGSFLQGCVLHNTMFGSPPPLPRTDDEIANLWMNARMMHSRTENKAMPLPSVVDAAFLWDVAKMVCEEEAKQLLK